MYLLRDTSPKVCCCKEGGCMLDLGCRFQRFWGAWVRQLCPWGSPLFLCEEQEAECSPTCFHSHEVNAEGDEMCMAALLWELIRLIKTRAVLAYCYTITYWVIQKRVLVLEKRWVSLFLLNKLIKGSGNRKGEGCCVSMWVANGTKVTSNVDGNSGRKKY